jgi:hypothetical protein
MARTLDLLLVWGQLTLDERPSHLDNAPLLVGHREVEHGFLPG